MQLLSSTPYSEYEKRISPLTLDRTVSFRDSLADILFRDSVDLNVKPRAMTDIKTQLYQLVIRFVECS